jgi:tetratricopeptide (TPR) repeat protein
MHPYCVRDVERLLQLSPSTIRALVARGFVRPARGPRREFRFSFQDLIVLRTARALALAKVPQRRISRSLSELRRHLPESAPLSGLSICAAGDKVVVRTGAARWQADSGQYLLGLDVTVAGDTLRVAEMQSRPSATAARAKPEALEREMSADDWYERGRAGEEVDPAAAIAAYEASRALDATHTAAHINLGRLLHEAGRLADAERVYREGLQHCGADATLYFNLAVLVEDARRPSEAAALYQQALTADADFADAHFNLARLYEQLGKPQHAIRHLARYRKLSGSGRD